MAEPLPIAPALFELDPLLAKCIDAICREHGDDPEDVIADLILLDQDAQGGPVSEAEFAKLLAEIGASP